MLLYASQGIRNYGHNPVRVYRRNAFEFQLIVTGSAVFTELTEKTPVTGPVLVLSSFANWHGWGALVGTECEVKVAHFSRVPYIIEDMLMGEGKLMIPLKKDVVKDFIVIHDRLLKLMLSTEAQSSLQAERQLLEICLFVVNHVKSKNVEDRRSRSKQIAENAIRLFKEQMSDGEGEESIAESLGYSPAHIRRIFQVEYGKSPREVFTDIRMREAVRLISDVGYQLTETAYFLGYKSLSAFSRSFKKYYGKSPSGYVKSQ